MTDDAQTEAALRAAIFAAPADDAPRAVYADWLIERDDPFGEFIGLQLRPTRKSAKRAMELLRVHRARIAGPLAPYIYAPSAVYERGFLASARLEIVDGGAPALPDWATVHTIAGGIPASDEHPMPLLHTATDVDASALVHLGALATPPPLAHLGIGDLARAVFAALTTVAPRLRTLQSVELERGALVEGEVRGSVVGPDQLAGLGWEPSAALAHITLRSHVRHLAAWLATPGPRRVTLLPSADSFWTLELERSSAGASVTAIPHGSPAPEALEALAYALDALPADTLASLAIQNVARNRWRQATVATIRRVLARQPRAEPSQIAGLEPAYTPPKR